MNRRNKKEQKRSQIESSAIHENVYLCVCVCVFRSPASYINKHRIWFWYYSTVTIAHCVGFSFQRFKTHSMLFSWSVYVYVWPRCNKRTNVIHIHAKLTNTFITCTKRKWTEENTKREKKKKKKYSKILFVYTSALVGSSSRKYIINTYEAKE